MDIEIRKGDISEIKVDAIVNAAGTSLHMGGGVAGALKRKGGIEIERDALKKAPIKLGDVVTTRGYRLNAKYVIHAAAMPHYGDRKATAESIEKAVRNSLREADRLKCKGIAFPAIGCGIAGFPIEKGSKVIIETIRNFKPENIKKAIIVLYSERDYNIFKACSD